MMDNRASTSTQGMTAAGAATTTAAVVRRAWRCERHDVAECWTCKRGPAEPDEASSLPCDEHGRMVAPETPLASAGAANTGHTTAAPTRYDHEGGRLPNYRCVECGKPMEQCAATKAFGGVESGVGCPRCGRTGDPAGMHCSRCWPYPLPEVVEVTNGSTRERELVDATREFLACGPDYGGQFAGDPFRAYRDKFDAAYERVQEAVKSYGD